MCRKWSVLGYSLSMNCSSFYTSSPRLIHCFLIAASHMPRDHLFLTMPFLCFLPRQQKLEQHDTHLARITQQPVIEESRPPAWFSLLFTTSWRSLT